MLRCFGGNDREFVSNPLEGTENCSTHSLRNSLLSSRSPPLFSGVSTAKGIIREFVGGWCWRGKRRRRRSLAIKLHIQIHAAQN